MQSLVPRLLWQTTHIDAGAIPDLLGSHAEGYERTVFRDDECAAFIAEHFPRARSAWERLTGAHKADLWRYCVLYVHGGVYLDIKTVVHQPLDRIFPTRADKPTWYAVACDSKKCLYNGVLASPPRNPIFLTLIDHIVETAPPRRYLDYVNHFKRAVEDAYGRVRGAGVFEAADSRLVVRQERCAMTECSKMRKKRQDRHNLCCNLYDRAIDPRRPIITIRDSDYPWDVPWRDRRNRNTLIVVVVIAAVVAVVVPAVQLLQVLGVALT